MGKQRTRRVRAARAAAPGSRDVWLKVLRERDLIHLDTPLGRWSVSRARLSVVLRRLGALAGMTGGLLWVSYYFLLGLTFILYSWDPLYDLYSFIYAPGVALPSISLLFSLAGLFSLYAARRTDGSKLRTVGYWLALAALTLIILPTVVWPFIKRLFPMAFPGDGVLFNDILVLPPFDWYRSVQSGLLILSLGFILIAIAEAQEIKWASWRWALVATSLLAMHLIGLIDNAQIAEMAIGSDIDVYRLTEFTAMAFCGFAVLFGTSWASLNLRFSRQLFGATANRSMSEKASVTV